MWLPHTGSHWQWRSESHTALSATVAGSSPIAEAVTNITPAAPGAAEAMMARAPGVGPKLAKPRGDERRFGDRQTADDDAPCASLQGALDGRIVAQAATHLKFETAKGGESLDQREMRRDTIASAVEIDHVQPARAKSAIARVQGLRGHLVAGLGVEVTVQEPDALPAA
jgi:hypothetical protein